MDNVRILFSSLSVKYIFFWLYICTRRDPNIHLATHFTQPNFESCNPWCLSQLFKTKNSQHCLRNWNFKIPRFNTTGYGKHTIRYQGPYIWSKLSKELRMSPTLKAIFKTRIRKLDLSDLIDNNSSCCKLCKSWTESFYIIS